MVSYEICYYKIPANFTTGERYYLPHDLIPKIFPKWRSYSAIMDKYKSRLDNNELGRLRIASRRGLDLKKWLNVSAKARYAFYVVKEE